MMRSVKESVALLVGGFITVALPGCTPDGDKTPVAPDGRAESAAPFPCERASLPGVL